jgi:hypothetical protein
MMKMINKKIKLKSRGLLYNKKADIAVTILVLGIIALCTLTLLSFELASRNQIKGVMKSAYLLQDVYAVADSISYSGQSRLNSYQKELPDYNIQQSENNLIIEKTYFKKDFGLALGANDEVIKVRHVFKP